MYPDRLEDAIARTGSAVCLGLDPFVELMPESFFRQYGEDPLSCIRAYLTKAMEAAAGRIPAVKPQSAFFEQFGARGVALFENLCQQARQMGFLVIADVKRGDIGTTAQAYARAYAKLADAVTVNPYMGFDSIKPFIDSARDNGGGVYVLVRTSNPSAVDLQDITDAQGRSIYERMADLVRLWGDSLKGDAGSAVGAVVGATWPQQGKRLRELMPETPFLIPGYGAQGGSAAGVKACRRLDNSKGVLVNSSRSLLYAWRETHTDNWQKALRLAIDDMNRNLKPS